MYERPSDLSIERVDELAIRPTHVRDYATIGELYELVSN